MARLAGSPWSIPAPDLERLVTQAAGAGLEYLHWDATDGAFAVAGGFGSDQACALAELAGVASEAHLMMHEPGAVIAGWARFCELVVVPVEIADWRGALREIETAGAVPALAVSPATPLGQVPSGDFPVLVMSVQPGQAGSDFRPATIERVRDLHARGCHAMVGVDGGVLPAHLPELAGAGATWVVSGTSLFGAPDVRAWLSAARHVLSGAPH